MTINFPKDHTSSKDTASLDILSNLPEPLLLMRRFLLWKAQPHPDKPLKVLKVPFYNDGTQRRGILDTEADLSKLSTLDDAKTEFAKGGYAGIGLALSGDGVGAFDLDHCLDEKRNLLPTHAGYDLAIQAEILGCYMEISPSGQGLRIVGPSANFPAYSFNGLEFWAEKRYVTLTGDLWANPGGWIGLDRLREPFGGGQNSPRTDQPHRQEDDEVLVTPRLIGELRDALSALSSDNREDWVRIGLALRTIGEPGRKLWMEWSARSTKFSTGDAERVWQSFKPTATNHKLIFAEAIREGWTNPNRRKGNKSGGFNSNDEDDEGNEESQSGSSDDDLIYQIGSNRISLDIGRLHPTEFILDGFLPVGVSVIAGAWGAGKSVNLIPLLASAAHLSPEGWGFRPTIRRKVVWVSEAPEQARDTIYSLAKEPGAATPEEFGEWFHLFRARRQPAKRLARMVKDLIKECTYELPNGFKVHPVVITDTTSANLEIENESDNSLVSQAMAILKQELPGVSLILIGHTPKALVKADVADMTFRGAGAWEADAAATYFLIHDIENDSRFLAIRKCRFSPSYHEIEFGFASGSEVIDTPWGMEQSKSYLHGVPVKSDGTKRKQAKEEAKEERKEERKEQTMTERQQRIMKFVVNQTDDGRPISKVDIRKELGGKAEITVEAINRLIESGRLVSYPWDNEIFGILLGSKDPFLLLPEGVDLALFMKRAKKLVKGTS